MSSIRLPSLICMLAALAAGTARVEAHPHVFAEARLDVMLKPDGHTVDALRHLWRFDEVFSSTVVLEFDKNGDYKLDDAELASVRQTVYASLGEYNYFQLVTANGNAALAQQAATDVADLAWALRDGFLGGVATFEKAATAIAARAPGAKPLVIVDIGDNPWTGGPGDSAELLRFLLEQGVENAALAIICDPESVAVCEAAGVSNQVDLVLGAKTDRLHGESLAVSAYVRSLGNGRYVNDGPMMAGVPVDLGPSAVIVCGPDAPARGIASIITSRAETPIDLNVFRSAGIEPTALDVIALKGKGHFRAAFEPIASEVILVEGPGITGADLSRLPFRHIRRPIWPIDEP